MGELSLHSVYSDSTRGALQGVSHTAYGSGCSSGTVMGVIQQLTVDLIAVLFVIVIYIATGLVIRYV